jgi:hypothetical protein
MQLQQALLQEAGRVVAAAQRVYSEHLRPEGSSAAEDAAAPQLAALLQLGRQAQAVARQLEQGDEGEQVLQALKAVFNKERSNTGTAGLDDFLRGHLNRCPNGHLYIIGECGGAMQRGRCAECGAAIGGEGHRLESTNRRVDEGLVRALVGGAGR